MSRQSIRKKFFLLLAMMGAIPFLIITIYDGLHMVEQLERNAVTDLWHRSAIVCDHLAGALEKDFAVLNALSVTPYLRQYVMAPTPEGEATVRNLLLQTNSAIQDENAMAVTAANGQQLLRTDAASPVNISAREHFQTAMKGQACISDAIQSMATGTTIVVLAVPVKDANGNPMGTLQRNFELSTIQDFIKKYADEDTSILVTDRDQNIIAHSEWNILAEKERAQANESYEDVRAVGGIQGVSRATVNGQECLISYTRSNTTGLNIYTIHPYRTIWKQANAEVLKRTILGLSVILLMGFIAYWLANRATRPIRAIAQVALRIANGEENIDKLQGFSDDEIGQVAHAINEMQSARAALQKEKERDPLTQIANNTAVEAFCRRKLKEFDDAEMPGLTAIYLIDLDHFGEANETLGKEYGDRILEAFANGLQGIFRLTDCVGRMNDDKFVVIADGLPGIEIIERQAESINRLARDLAVDGNCAGLSASIGIAVVPRHGKTYNHLLHAAHAALGQAKAHGRDGYCMAGDGD